MALELLRVSYASLRPAPLTGADDTALGMGLDSHDRGICASMKNSSSWVNSIQFSTM